MLFVKPNLLGHDCRNGGENFPDAIENTHDVPLFHASRSDRDDSRAL
jgi:hypothetical protein